MESRADLHIHSKYSDRPSDWILRRIGAPQSFVEPREIYARCKQRGMNFVTITDHNCIDGCLDIADQNGAFISNLVTTYFPEDHCKVQCLTLGISEDQFKHIQEVRPSIYEFAQYVDEQDIICSVAHPLYRVNNRLSVEHFEKLLLLFKRFEVLNGTRSERASAISQAVCGGLTEDLIHELANKHGIAPAGRQPWKKWGTAGSGDYGGLYAASAYTQTPYAGSVEEFLGHLRSGDHTAAGSTGTSLKLAHSFYQIGYSYYKSRFVDGTPQATNLVAELFRRLLEGGPHRKLTLTEKLWYVMGRFSGRSKNRFGEVEKMLVEELTALFRNQHERDQDVSNVPDDRRIFELACAMSHHLSFAFVQKFVGYLGEGRLLESLQTLASLGPVALAIAPYLTAFGRQHRDEPLHRAVAASFPAARSLVDRSDRRVWATDTLIDVNGVTRTIRAMSQVAADNHKPLTIMSCLSQPPEMPGDYKNFRPIGEFDLPEYQQQRICVPPFMEILEWLERKQFSEAILSTPGPLGLAVLGAARILGLRTKGIYHTDFPLIVRQLTQDNNAEQLTKRFMIWFYGQLDHVFVPSEFYRRQLMDYGLAPERLSVMRRGVDLEVFHPERRDDGFLRGYGAGDKFKFLYVGRVSNEKNIDVLLDAFGVLTDRGVDCELVICGDGPQLATLKHRYRSTRTTFTGFLNMRQVATAMASSDVFVFPSTSDTFGNAVLEAQACGIPSIVSSRGGPAEIVGRKDSGLVVDIGDPAVLANAMQRLVEDHDLRQTLAARSLESARESDWPTIFNEFWDVEIFNGAHDNSILHMETDTPTPKLALAEFG